MNFTQLNSISSNIVSASSNTATIIHTITNGNISAYAAGGIVSGSSQILGGSGLFSSSVQVGNYVATIAGTTNQISVAGSGTTNAAITLSTPQDIATTSNVTFNNITASAGIRAIGDIVAYYSSDERLKENINPIENALSKVELISGNTYDWKPELKEFHGFEGNDVGVIAQEIEEILPQLVTTRETGYKAVKYDKLVALLIEGIKEQQSQIHNLTLEVENLKKQKGL